MSKYGGHCGADYFPKWLRKLLSFPLNDACRLHDRFYENKKHSKLKSDLIFFYYGFRISAIWLIKGVIGILFVPLFFMAVTLFGKRSWKGLQ